MRFGRGDSWEMLVELILSNKVAQIKLIKLADTSRMADGEALYCQPGKLPTGQLDQQSTNL